MNKKNAETYQVRIYEIDDDVFGNPDDPAKPRTCIREEWRDETGRFHRAGDLPAIIDRDALTDELRREQYYLDGERHRDSGPALIERDLWLRQEWWLNGKRHRPESDGPAVIEKIIESGLITWEEWYKFGERHRVNGPAFVFRNDDGIVEHELWEQADHGLHREDGPAEICRDPRTGFTESEQFFLNGKAVPRPSSSTLEP